VFKVTNDAYLKLTKVKKRLKKTLVKVLKQG